MNRRRLLITSAIVFTGSLLGFHRLVPAQAALIGTHPCGPKMALIIDDIGHSRQMAHRFLEIQIPITFSILPRLPFSLSLAGTIHELGHEIMLHQPMEPNQATIDPGPGAIYVNDSSEQIARTIATNISELARIRGTNNHMGSRFTQNLSKMTAALNIVHQKGLYFVDSLTTACSKGFTSARHLKMGTRKRDLFIDPVADADVTFNQLRRLKRRATLYGTALGIGHPYPETLAGLKRFVRSNQLAGVELVYASGLIDGRPAKESNPETASPSHTPTAG